MHRTLLLLCAVPILLGCPPPDKPVRQSADPKATVNSACITCHERKAITGGALRDWSGSVHARQGVACEACHVPPAGAKSVLASSASCEDKRVRRSVSSKSCAECHKERVDQFAKGKHAAAWVAMAAMPTTKDQPKVAIEGLKGCGGCHRIGLDEGKCDSCHTRHRFAAAEARRPEACATCHMGFDHPQWEMYSTSKHGALYRLEGDRWRWDKKLSDLYGPHAKAADRPRAPVCASCHMPDGDHAVRTAWGFLAVRLPEQDKEWMAWRATILQGLGVLDDKGQPTARLEVVKAGDVARLSSESWQKERDRVQQVCVSCHSASYAKDELGKADQLIREADRVMAEAIEIVRGLYRDGLLKPKDYPASVDLLRFYDVEHPIEQTLWVMFLEHRMRTFQGAFHMNPDYQHWYGWAEMKRDLAEIRRAAVELRAAPEKRPPPKKAARP